MIDDHGSGLDSLGNPLSLRMNRREFLEAAGGGIFLFITVGGLPTFAQEGPGRVPQQSQPTDFNAYLRIGENGRVACYTGKIEMGQGIITSLAQMLADELDVRLDSVDMVMGDTDLCPWDRGTFGSMTTRFFGPSLRAAGAEGRRVLLELASERLKTPVEHLVTEDGVVFDKRNRRRRIAYAELAHGKRIERHLAAVSVKDPSAFRLMRKPVLRKDAQEKVTGQAKYAGDIRVPDMLYAKILRPPAHGAKLLSVDLADAMQVKGVQIIQERDFIAVLHDNPDVAELALSKITAHFDTPASVVDEKSIFDHLPAVAPEGAVLARDGDLRVGEQRAKTLVEATYVNEYVAHAPIEPHTAVVRVKGNKATAWVSTQAPFAASEEVARELGIPPQNVRVITPFVGGGFGGKTRNLQVVEAARLARLSGRPVQVAWSRREEFFYDSFRPAAVVKVRSGVTEKGRVSFWDYRVYFAGDRGAQQFYDVPHHRTTVHNPSWVGAPGSHPFATGPWRAPGNNTNTFARESQIDSMAAKAGMDPLEFRLQNLTDPRMQRVLRAAAQKFGWRPAKTPSGQGCGIACGTDAGTYVATIAEVGVDRGTGTVQVKRVVCALDMGMVINPEGATIQTEGCITMGLGYALKEQIHFRGGEILDLNFDAYEIPRFSWLPRIETILLEDPHAEPGGGGEPAIITMGAVLANAIHDAIGVRMLQLPMTPERIREAMKG